MVPKAAVLHRGIARALDFLIVSALYQVPILAGFYGGLVYLLIADGFAGGGSVGKQLIGLRVVCEDGRPASFRESILRNVLFAAAYLFFPVYLVGVALLLVVVCFEGLLVLGHAEGRRIGDELAKTRVRERA